MTTSTPLVPDRRPGRWRAAALAASLAASLAACGGGRASPECSADPAPAPDAVAIDVTIEPGAGDQRLGAGTTLRSPAGVEYTVSALRFYLSHVALTYDDGRVVPAVLADDAGQPLRYGVTLVDHAIPSSETLHLLAPPGHYRALSLSVGVPATCSDGDGVLNHENASEQAPPLDVDSDMYWGWDPGYVFFKLEGRYTSASGPRSYLFHVGDDHRYTTATIAADLAVSTLAPAHHRVAFDLDRLFTTPAGATSPDLTGETTSNHVHGGSEANVLAQNLALSEVFQWRE